MLQNASSKVDYVFGAGLYMAPSDMRVHIGKIVGYNNELIIAHMGQLLGVDSDITTLEFRLLPGEAVRNFFASSHCW